MGNKNINPNLKKGAYAQSNSSVAELAEGIRAGDRAALSLGITLIESNHPTYLQKSMELLDLVKPDYIRSSAHRIAISGSPGVGKSTLIESLIQEKPKAKFAILTIDPSSEQTKGSILGDKTRMESSSTLPNVFIRPSPSNNVLGGVGSKTREVMLLCEAAGFDHIIIETVGVGQSETIVSKMVDLFILLVLPGSGDEIQGIKRGIVELADLVIVTKSDNERVNIAKQSARAFKNALHILSGKYSNKSIPVLAVSSYDNKGMDIIWEEVQNYKTYFSEEERLIKLRQSQVFHWYEQQLKEDIYRKYLADEKVQLKLAEHRKEIEKGSVNVWKMRF